MTLTKAMIQGEIFQITLDSSMEDELYYFFKLAPSFPFVSGEGDGEKLSLRAQILDILDKYVNWGPSVVVFAFNPELWRKRPPPKKNKLDTNKVL